MEQVEHLVAKRCIEATPSGRRRAGSLELEGPLPGEPTGVLDRARGWVVTETLGDAAPVGAQPGNPPRLHPTSRTRLPTRSISIVSSIAVQTNACSSCIASSAVASRQ